MGAKGALAYGPPPRPPCPLPRDALGSARRLGERTDRTGSEESRGQWRSCASPRPTKRLRREDLPARDGCPETRHCRAWDRPCRALRAASACKANALPSPEPHEGKCGQRHVIEPRDLVDGVAVKAVEAHTTCTSTPAPMDASEEHVPGGRRSVAPGGAAGRVGDPTAVQHRPRCTAEAQGVRARASGRRCGGARGRAGDVGSSREPSCRYASRTRVCRRRVERVRTRRTGTTASIGGRPGHDWTVKRHPE